MRLASWAERFEGLCWRLNEWEQKMECQEDTKDIIELMRALRKLTQHKEEQLKRRPQDEGVVLSQEAEWEAVQAILGRYKIVWSLEIGVHRDHPGLDFRAFDARPLPSYADVQAGKPFPQQSTPYHIETVREAARAGLLSHIKRCEWCDIWFFAKREWQRFHSTQCRHEHFLATRTPQEEEEARRLKNERQRAYRKHKLRK